MHVARPYALVALFTLMIMWSYYRINILRPMGRRSNFEQICFLIVGVGICYTHYFSALLIVALALWHFLFMLRKRSWWRQTSLFILIAILSLPQLNGFLGGISTTQTAWHFTDENMMRFSEILPWFFYVLTNGIVSTPSTFVMVLAVTLFLACTGIRKKLWLDNEFHRIWLLPFITLTLLFLILMSNEIVLVFRQERLRYFMVMWPLVALSVGCVVHRTRALLRFITILMTITYFAVGFTANVASELRYEFYDLLKHIPVHIAHNIVEKNSSARDLLLFDHTLGFPREFYFRPLPYDRIEIRSPDHGQMELSSEAEKYLRIWLLADVANSELYRTLTINLANELVHCDRYLDRKNLVLELYAWSAVYCPGEKTERMLFGEDIELAAPVVEVVSEETLQIELLLHSDKANRMAAFSVALHVFDVESGAKVAQGDQGLWLGRFNPLRSEIDISGLMAGDYELRVAVYNWQTHERLEGVDLASGATGNLLPLFRFQVE